MEVEDRSNLKDTEDNNPGQRKDQANDMEVEDRTNLNDTEDNNPGQREDHANDTEVQDNNRSQQEEHRDQQMNVNEVISETRAVTYITEDTAELLGITKSSSKAKNKRAGTNHRASSSKKSKHLKAPRAGSTRRDGSTRGASSTQGASSAAGAGSSAGAGSAAEAGSTENADNRVANHFVIYGDMTSYYVCNLYYEENDEEELLRELRLANLLTCADIGPVAGGIISLRLYNFMCHKSLELQFNKRINFVVGKNGSGKSAIMTAILLTLGSSAADTQRGKQLQNFVANGCKTAKIELTLNNEGQNAWRPDRAGSYIKIIRRFTETSSTLHMKTALTGMERLNRETLKDILRTYKIFLPNPFAMMTQENMKIFLNNRQASEMYQMFLDGANVREAQNTHERVRRQFNHCIKLLIEIKEQQEAIYQSHDMVTNYLQRLKAFQVAQEIIKVMDLYLSWVELYESICNFKKKLQELKQKERAYNRFQENITKKIDKIKELEEKAEKNSTEIARRLKEEAKDKGDIDTQENELRELRAAIEQQQERESRLKAKAREKHIEIANLVELFKKRESRNADDVRKEYEEKKKQLADLQQKIPDLRRHLNESCQRLERWEEQLKVKKNEQIETEILKEQYEQEIPRFRTDVEIYRNANSDIAKKYGKPMEKFVNAIHGLKNKLTGDIIGPIGRYVKVNEPEWEPMIERVLSSELRAFLIYSLEDEEKVKAVSEVTFSYYDRIVTAVANHESIRYGGLRIPEPMEGFTPILDMLEIEKPEVFNYLITVKRLESTLLVHHGYEKQAIKLMTDGRIQDCKTMYTINGHTINAAPFRYYPCDSPLRKARILNSVEHDHEEFVQERQRGLENAQLNLSIAKTQLEEIKESLNELEKATKEERNKSRDLKHEIVNIEDRESELSFEVDTLKGDLERIEIDHVKIRLDNLQKESGEVEEELKQLKLDINKLVSECNKKMATRESMSEDRRSNFEQLRNLDRENFNLKNHIESEKKELEQLKEECEEQRKALETFKTETNTEEANLNTTLIEFQRRKKMPKLEKSLADNKYIMLHMKSVVLKYIENAKKLLTVSEEKATAVSRKLLGELTRHFDTSNCIVHAKNALRRDIKTRAGRYNAKITWTFVDVTEVFKVQFQDQRFHGELIFNHDACTMNIVLKDNSNNEVIANPSGGERSYTILALILSTWVRLRCPFYILDEFDVFLDAVNRNVCMEKLLKSANRNKSFQYIFLTPQEVHLPPKIINDENDLSIIHLRDPRPSQNEETLDMDSAPFNLGYSINYSATEGSDDDD